MVDKKNTEFKKLAKEVFIKQRFSASTNQTLSKGLFDQ